MRRSSPPMTSMIRPRALSLGVICIALALSGCDTFYGVTRNATLGTYIQIDCARHVIEATPGVEKLDYAAVHTGKGLFHPTPWAYNFSFVGTPKSNTVGSIQIYKEYDGSLSYHASLIMINQKPPQAWIDATRPVMLEIEKQLATQCGATDLPTNLKETCQGVVCGPL